MGVSAAGRREPAAADRVIEDLARTNESRGGGLRGRQGVLAEVAQGVVAAFEEFAREREAGSVTADPLGGLQVVLAVGAARMPRLLRGFVQRPAERGRSLAAQMPGRAVLV